MKKLLTLALAVTMSLAGVFSASAALSGDLTVDTFFSTKSEMQELKSGDSYTIKFNNKSNGTNNYENYVLGIVGATGAAYTGADQEVVIIRGDSWGWGGKMSDFVAPDAASGNKLAFTNNITDFAAWAAAMQAGADVTITLSRTGNTINYKATMGTYEISTTATSGVALPETCYFFFTGEKVTLKGITVTNASAAAATTAAVKETSAVTETTTVKETEKATTAKATTKATTTKVEDKEKEDSMSPIVIVVIAVVAVAVVGGIVVATKKKNK